MMITTNNSRFNLAQKKK